MVMGFVIEIEYQNMELVKFGTREKGDSMRFRIDIDVFSISVFFYFGDEEKKRFAKNTGGKESDVNGDGVTLNNAVWIKDDNAMDAIIHESHHAKKFIVEHKGIHDEEVEAYIITYLVSEAVRRIRKIRGNKKL